MNAATGFRMHPQPDFNFGELVVDNFAGGGGASTGIELAMGRSVDIAINHDIDAIRMHETNHPHTRHYCESVWDIDPRKVTAGQPVGLAWFSPDCKHFSKAKGGKPVEKAIRGLAWVAVRWAATVKPRIIMLENVEEFKTWGPLTRDGKPCKKQTGKTFRSFTNALKRLGYDVEFKELRACDYGAPTIRKRLFMVARRDNQPIQWPTPTHGDPASPEVKAGILKPYRTAADIIDWSLPCPSIFERKKPLAENTLRRIARGIQKFVVDNPTPFIVTCNHSGNGFRGQSIDQPFKTVTASRDAHGVVDATLMPFITEYANSSSQRNMPSDEPLRTICAQVKGGHFAVVAPIIERTFSNSEGNAADAPLGTITAGGGGKAALCAAFLSKYYGPKSPNEIRGQQPEQPIHTITTGNRHSLITSNLIKLRGTSQHGQPTDEPLPTITAGGNHVGEVRAFLLKYYGNEKTGVNITEPMHTVPTRDRFGLVTVHGEDYQIVDIGMRMLQPHELFAAQGFPADYIIDRDHTGKTFSKDKQVARCGNSVCPDIARALVQANMTETSRETVAA
ncbi:DNA (cytosine-5)-methyltransferase 1 [Amphritea atlantica]|uniref:DNA (cytosine-5-)-methyltransferase n=1 Tax=Amphritea atlantica TaxID=355243 RepID=A0A1H9GDH1_9GAMM|nr:DNA cytosine methyltransferase [Amphritea atlantica]SEQ48195.1 DNA (cytosine-5)-methyltransferase 1 [Amphritea atlantica]